MAGCLVDPENTEMSLVGPDSSESYMILCPGPYNPWNMPFTDFHRHPEACISVNRIELKREIVIQKLYPMDKQKSGP